MKSFAIAAFLIAATLTAAPVRAWWCYGHMTVAEIALQNLVPNARECVQAYIGYLSLVGPFPKANEMTPAACWADDLKSDKLYVMASWHFVDYPYNPTDYPTTYDFQKENVTAVITSLQGTLRRVTSSKPPNFWEVSYALANLIHFYGDVHQPLHCAALYSAEFPSGDMGGNLFKVSVDGKHLDELHAVWDSVCGEFMEDPERPLNATGSSMINSTARRFAAEMDASITAEEKAVSNATAMAEESFQHAVHFAYANNTLIPGSTLTPEYLATCKNVAKKRIVLAGYRLASFLNSVFAFANCRSLPNFQG